MQTGAGKGDMVSKSIIDFARAAVCAALLAPLALLAAEEGARLQTAPINLYDSASLQNGAKVFVNYCLNCHSASYMRYNRLQDLGLTEQQIGDNLIFTGVKVGELMQVAMDKHDAKEWFGVAPPDLTVTARSRSSGAGSGAAIARSAASLTSASTSALSFSRPSSERSPSPTRKPAIVRTGSRSASRSRSSFGR